MDSTSQDLDPQAIARAVALEVADDPEQVGDFANAIDLGDGVTDFRFACLMRGYEGWQWSVTLYHDAEMGSWTVNESSLTPTDEALRPPEWIPWKDRLEPGDLSPTDSIGTDPDDPRMEESEVEPSSLEDVNDAAETFALSRRHVLSPLGRAQTAKRWYEGPRGPKALSTKTASGNPCSTCGFFVPLAGELNRMFGVCANKWSPDDGRVVSLDHGCGEHSEIEPPEPSRLWVQSKPAFDDLHIDVVAQKPRDERGQIEMLEEIVSDAREGAREDADEIDATDELDGADVATEADIEAHVADEADDEAIADQTTPESEEPEVEATVRIAVDEEDADEPDEMAEPSEIDESSETGEPDEIAEPDETAETTEPDESGDGDKTEAVSGEATASEVESDAEADADDAE